MTENPWEGVDMPEGFDPDENKFLQKPGLDNRSQVGWSIVRNKGEKTQGEWRKYDTTEIAEKRDRPTAIVYASMADIYALCKDRVSGPHHGLTEGMHVITATRINYYGGVSGLEAVVVHYRGSVEQRKRVSVLPHLRSTPLSKVVKTKPGLRFARALFGTYDNADTIVRVMQEGLKTDIGIVTRGVYQTVPDRYRTGGGADGRGFCSIKYSKEINCVGSPGVKGIAVFAHYSQEKWNEWVKANER